MFEQKNGITHKILSIVLSLSFLFTQTGFAQVAGELNLSSYFGALHGNASQDRFRPLHLRYFSYDGSSNDFKVILDKGDSKDAESALNDSAKGLLDYFLVGVTLTDDSFWVNLRPDSQANIIDDYLAQTDLGKVLLESDLQLKKDTAKFTSPATAEGKAYWDKLYQKAEELFGQENITIPTLTRPWIIPGEIILRQTENSAYIYKASLKVCLEQDHLKNSASYNFSDPRLKALNEYSSQLIRELIIPKLTQEVNTSRRYASLRQVYYSLIMARWFKTAFYGKPGQYSSLIDKKDLTNLMSASGWSKTTYFNEYQKSFQKGEYNLKVPVTTPSGQTIRSYFSGGIDITAGTMKMPNSNSASSPVGTFFARPGGIVEKALFNNATDVSFAGNARTSVFAPAPVTARAAVSSPVQITQNNPLFGDLVYQRGDGIALFKANNQFIGSRGMSAVGTIIAAPENIRFDVQHLPNAQGNLTIYDRSINKRQYRPGPSDSVTSDSGVIRSKFMSFSEAMKNSLQNQPDSQALTWLDYSNNFGNPNNVSFVKGQLFYPTGFNMGKKFEQDFAKPLYSLVQYSDGRVEFGYVRYEITSTERTEGYYDIVHARAFIGERELPADTVAFSAIPLVAHGQPADLPSAIKAGMFQDLRHLFSLPLAKHPNNAKGAEFSLDQVPVEIRAGVYFGLEELSANDYEKAALALDHPVSLPMTLSVTQERKVALTQDQTRTLLASGGYVEETDPSRIQARQPEEGKYLFASDSEIIIFLKPGIYPHLLIGQTDDGNIFVQSIGGASGRIGISIKETFSYANKLGLRELMSVSQGTGSLIGYLPEGLGNDVSALESNYQIVVGASEGRQQGSAIINIVSVKSAKGASSPVTQGYELATSIKGWTNNMYGAYLPVGDMARRAFMDLLPKIKASDKTFSGYLMDSLLPGVDISPITVRWVTVRFDPNYDPKEHNRNEFTLAATPQLDLGTMDSGPHLNMHYTLTIGPRAQARDVIEALEEEFADLTRDVGRNSLIKAWSDVKGTISTSQGRELSDSLNGWGERMFGAYLPVGRIAKENFVDLLPEINKYGALDDLIAGVDITPVSVRYMSVIYDANYNPADHNRHEFDLQVRPQVDMGEIDSGPHLNIHYTLTVGPRTQAKDVIAAMEDEFSDLTRNTGRRDLAKDWAAYKESISSSPVSGADQYASQAAQLIVTGRSNSFELRDTALLSSKLTELVSESEPSDLFGPSVTYPETFADYKGGAQQAHEIRLDFRRTVGGSDYVITERTTNLVTGSGTHLTLYSYEIKGLNDALKKLAQSRKAVSSPVDNTNSSPVSSSPAQPWSYKDALKLAQSSRGVPVAFEGLPIEVVWLNDQLRLTLYNSKEAKERSEVKAIKAAFTVGSDNWVHASLWASGSIYQKSFFRGIDLNDAMIKDAFALNVTKTASGRSRLEILVSERAMREINNALLITQGALEDGSTWELVTKFSPVSSPVENKTAVGGIDLRTMNIDIRPMGSLSGVNLLLPPAPGDLASVDINNELSQIKIMLQKGIIPSGERVKGIVCACYYKKELTAKLEELILCMRGICKLEEQNAQESQPGLKESLIIIDSATEG